MLLLANRLRKALWRAHEIELERGNLSVPQWLILSELAQGKGATLTHFSRLLGYDAGSLSRVIHQLRQRDLVSSVTPSQDRRSAPLQLSAAGRALYAVIEARVGRLPPVLANALGSRRMALLASLMEVAIVLLEQQPAGRGGR